MAGQRKQIKKQMKRVKNHLCFDEKEKKALLYTNKVESIAIIKIKNEKVELFVS